MHSHLHHRFLLIALICSILVISFGLRSFTASATAPNHLFVPLIRSPGTPVVLPQGEPWSDPATWGGSLPAAGAAVIIPAGKTVLLDVSPPALRSLQIDGTLIFANQDLALTADWIMLHGTGRLRIGDPAAPFQHQATITLTGANRDENVMGMGTRGIMLMGGALELYGAAPEQPWTQLAAHADAGATSLTLRDAVDWQAGDQIVVAPTDYYGVAETEQLELRSADGTTLDLASPLGAFRWGLLQYVNAEGVTLEPTDTVTDLVLDQRAEVGNLTRRIVIQGVDDPLWRDHGFGAHIMAMAGSALALDGVELRRVGQAGIAGRYPIHWHMLSYDTSGAELGDATGQFVANSTIWDSANRCITVHATNGITLRNNICYDIAGHAIFLEDAVERRNLIEGNLVLKVRRPANPLIGSDRGEFRRGPSGFWITNPDNTLRGNVAADAEGNGFWLAFPERPLGPSSAVNLRPTNMAFGVFSHNVAHSNRDPGINLDHAPFDDTGNTREIKYTPTSDAGPDRYAQNRIRFTLSDVTIYKNRSQGFWNRVSWPTYERFVSADNVGMFFAGAGDDGKIINSLIIGTSLNNATPYPSRPGDWDYQAPAAAASYHSTFDIADNVIVNFPVDAATITRASGAFATNDYYTRAVDKGLIRNFNNRLINSDGGMRVISPNLNDPVGNAALAGALWDPHGYWGPAGNYWVYDIPFLTAERTCTPVAPVGQNGQSCAGPYYGVGGFIVDGSERFQPRMPIEVTRLDAQDNPIDVWAIEEGSGNGRNSLGIMPWMRHFAAVPGGRYVLRFRDATTTLPDPSDVTLSISNAYRADDSLIIGISYSGSANAQGYLTTHNTAQIGSLHRRELVAVNSYSELVGTSMDSIWQDRANNLVWVRISGGLPSPGEANWAPNSDAELYRHMTLRIYQ
jgi:hypothetical protein